MKRIIHIILLAYAAPLCTNGQFTIQGLVTDNKNKPLSQTNIELKGTAAGSFTTSSDSLGFFKLSNIPAGKYTLNTSHVSLPGTSIPIRISRDTFIYVASAYKTDTLATAIVTAQRPTFERKIDRFVFNLNNSAILPGNNVWEVLKQTPMVRANETGGVGLLGNAQDATVFINRRRFPLSGEDLQRYLKDMPADNIIRIEILSIPPPSYDVIGPVIDIQLKRMEINGTKGSLSGTYEQASVGRESGSLALDMNRNNYNQSLLINGSFGNQYQRIDKTTVFKTSPGNTTIDSDIETNGRRKRVNAFTDIRYSISPVLTTGTQWTVTRSLPRNTGKGNEVLYPPGTSSRFDQTVNSDRTFVSGNLFLKFYSERTKTSAELSGDLLHSRLKQESQFVNTPNTGSIQTKVPQQLNNQALKFDYSSPVGKSVVEAGARWSNSTINTPYEVFTLSGSGWVKLNHLSATFKYRERILASYLTWQKTLSPKWSTKLGVRVERTDITTTSIGVKTQEGGNDYTFIFPVGYLNYNPSKKHSFSLSSRTSNSRPEYFSLNPARILIGSRTITEGNPFLNPSGGGVIELTYGYKQAYFIGLNYTTNTRLFSQMNEVLPPDTLLIKWQNWGDQKQYNIWFFTNKELVKSKWSVALNIFAGHNRRKLADDKLVNGKYLNNNQLNLYMGNTFTNIFSKKLRMYCNISYSGPSRNGLWYEQPSFRTDAGFSYNIPKWAARVTVAFNDVFKYNDRNAYVTNETNEQYTKALTNNDARNVRLTISKSFGNQKTKKLNRRETANEEEKGRAG